MWLHKCLKSPLSEDPSTSNMVNRPKSYWYLNDSNFTIVIDHCQLSVTVGSDCLLTHWLLLRSILFSIETNYSNIFRWNYLRQKGYFLNFFWHFRNLDLIVKIFFKKEDPHSGYIFELTDSEKRGYITL